MSSAIAKVAKAFRAEHGARFNPALLDRVRPGAVVEINGAHDVDWYTDLEQLGLSLPAPTPAANTHAFFERHREAGFDAGVDLALAQMAGASAGLGLAVQQGRSVRFAIADQSALLLDKHALEVALLRALDADPEGVKRALKRPQHHIVTGVYLGRAVVSFEGQGQGAVDLRGEMPGAGALQIGARWRWKTSATLETEELRPYAFETGRLDLLARRLIDTSR